MPTITNQGAIPIPPTTLLAEEVAAALLLAPGVTTDLPGSLIEDMASTATGALVVIDQATSDLINSISPLTANGFLLYQLGQVYGVQQGIGANTSVFVTFISSNLGFVINPGVIVSDGTNQYVVQDGGVIQTSGQSTPLFCISTTPGSFAVPIGTVIQIISSVPPSITISCINLVTGIPGEPSQTIEDYRSQVIQAGQATAQGVPQFLKTQLEKIVGVQSNLVSVRASGTQWEIIVGGGDPYAVANAILTGIPDIFNIVGSTLIATAITNAYPAVVTTNLNHGYSTGQIITFAGALGMSGLNAIPYTVIVLSETTFSLNVAITSLVWSASVVTVTTTQPHNLPVGTSAGHIYNALPAAYSGAFTFTRTGTNTFTYPLVSNPGAATQTGYTGFDSVTSGTYTASSAIITPNLRNITVSLNDYPDTYSITFVNPPQQSVIIDLTWNTIATNFVSDTAIAQVGAPAITAYINQIPVGQPINIFDMQAAFLASISGLLQIQLISKMIFSVSINGIVTAPVVNTGTIFGDPESYFNTTTANVFIIQG
jgi:hypothetical protein